MIEILEYFQPVSHDSAVSELIRAMMDGRIHEIKPRLDFTQEVGAVYPQVEEMLGQSTGEVMDILLRLTQENILEARFFDRLIFCPACNSMNLRPSLRCPKCGSANIARGRVFEHFACGKNGLEDEFVAGGKYLCPHCGKQLKFLGTDYRSLGVNYKCHACGALSNEMAVRWSCMKCSQVFSDEEARVRTIYSYGLNEQSRNWLVFDMGYKTRLIDYLRRQGYEVFEKAMVNAGSGSGAIHTLDILARRDDGFLTLLIGIGIAIGINEEDIGLEDVFRFDNKAYDLGIHDKVLLAVPGMSSEARQFARRQRIKSYDLKEMEALLTSIATAVPKPVKYVPFTFENRGQLLKYLWQQGYRVEEKSKITGRSGAEYTMDIVAYFDDGIFTHTISIGTVTDKDEISLEAVSAYDTKAYDIGIHDKILLVYPALSKQARQFAEQQKIRIIQVASPAVLK
jgi:predicted RNA-binding Zn-ribbon protein involved in translation (DUF1610 family)